ncbi:probable polygalacturonase At3g15720 [Cicer arietinum]|uniref:Probable polygalacturonase At3g15720 n=1 Tax=Cicer arietinum TaxID=3827 RepID=A0A1S2XI44_CICAR|nr:probable polygalacturonase At3g15720 [Cicer arietinum]
MKFLFVVLVIFVVVSPCICARLLPYIIPSFNVLDYGAVGNGKNDETQAFVDAWKDTCSAIHDSPTLLIPKGKTFILQPLWFQGPCNSTTVYVKLEGTIKAPNKIEAWKWPNNNEKETWIRFSEINGLIIYGSGQIDGQGAPWWDCYSNTNCDRPTALHFHACENLILRGLTHINSPRNHISLNACHGSHISKLHIIAPNESPNTDGIDIAESSNVIIENSKMETGDDCIAINHGSSSINIIGIFCGPGHGISVGSLGRNGADESVENIYVRNCTFNGTTNGARIKTWMGGHGYARKVTFEDIIVIEAYNPVIIDQEYNPYDSVHAVKVSDVTFRNIRGTSISKHAIQLNCDEAISCTNIILEGINITSSIGEEVHASCKNAKGMCTSCIPYVPCLSQE